MKFSGSDNAERASIVIVFLLPLILLFLFLHKDALLLVTNILFFVVYLIVGSYYFYWTIFDWDIFVSANKIVLKRLFSKDVTIEEITSLQVKRIPFLTKRLRLFKLILNGETYLFKVKAKKPIFRFFVDAKDWADKIETELKELLKE